MIVHNINSNLQIVFVDDPRSEYLEIAREIGYTKKDGDLYKYVNLNLHAYYIPYGGYDSIEAVHLNAKGIDTYIISKKIPVTIYKSNLKTITDSFNRFGDDYNASINGNELGSNLKRKDKQIENSLGVTFGIGKQQEQIADKLVNNMIYKLSANNGHMLAPVIKRFLNTVHLFKGKKDLLTGYFNLRNYLYMVKSPMNFGNIEIDSDNDYDIFIDNEVNNTYVEVIGVNDGIVSLDLKLDCDVKKSIDIKGKIDPFIFITTKPMILRRERIPYKIVSYRGTTLFISMLLFLDSKILTEIKGGINLLK